MSNATTAASSSRALRISKQTLRTADVDAHAVERGDVAGVDHLLRHVRSAGCARRLPLPTATVTGDRLAPADRSRRTRRRRPAERRPSPSTPAVIDRQLARPPRSAGRPTDVDGTNDLGVRASRGPHAHGVGPFRALGRRDRVATWPSSATSSARPWRRSRDRPRGRALSTCPRGPSTWAGPSRFEARLRHRRRTGATTRRPVHVGRGRACRGRCGSPPSGTRRWSRRSRCPARRAGTRPGQERPVSAGRAWTIRTRRYAAQPKRPEM